MVFTPDVPKTAPLLNGCNTPNDSKLGLPSGWAGGSITLDLPTPASDTESIEPIEEVMDNGLEPGGL